MTNRNMQQMTTEERKQCIGMWADVVGFTKPTPIVDVDDMGVELLYWGNFIGNDLAHFWFYNVTPRFDLPRCWTPEGKPTPGHWEKGEVTHTEGPVKRFINEWEKDQ